MDWRDAPLGGQVNRGWVPLVDELHRRVQQFDPDIRVAQVKEKFGMLRYYYDHGEESNPNRVLEQGSSLTMHEEIERLVAEAEVVSGWLCEVCGKPGHTDGFGHGWLNTLCAEHAEIRRTEGTPAWKIAKDAEA